MKLEPISLLKDKDRFEEVLELLTNKFQLMGFINFDKYVNEENIELYYWLKSYRSNLTEGNTTTDDAFTKIILSNNEDRLYSDTYDEQYEIIDLKINSLNTVEGLGLKEFIFLLQKKILSMK